jgi:hypothetical protein
LNVDGRIRIRNFWIQIQEAQKDTGNTGDKQGLFDTKKEVTGISEKINNYNAVMLVMHRDKKGIRSTCIALYFRFWGYSRFLS